MLSEPVWDDTLPPDFVPEPAPEDLPFIVPYKGKATFSWLPGSGDRLGFTDLDAQLTLAVPSIHGFLVTPGFGVHFLNGPRRTDAPSTLYETWLEFAYRRQASERLAYEVAVAPGVYSDFQQGSSRAIRITGRGIAFWQWTPDLQAVLGVAYLDRDDVRILPVFGLIHVPYEDLRLELVFPRPRIARRYLIGPDFERWMYLSGEFGGGTWAVERDNGRNDVLTYGDWRLIAGIENRHQTGRAWLVELAYVFNRRLEFQSRRGNFRPDPTIMLRAGASF